MSHSVLRTIISEISNSPFLTIMVDETTDVANKEQLTLVIRRVDDNFEVHEEFLGLYNLLSTTADSIVDSIKDVLLRFQIPTSKIRGQCYDGCKHYGWCKGWCSYQDSANRA